jgi:uncharacterized protein (TIGR03084 family)
VTTPETDRSDARASAAAARHRQVTQDLREETRSLQEVLDGVDLQAWSTPTPAAGWTVQDQVNHLAYFDEATVLAVTNPERFRSQAAELSAPGDDFPDRLVRRQRSLSPEQSAAWFARARAALLDLAADASPGLRLPWYGPDMSITSTVTARLMETWAHGQDIADALDVPRTPTDRLRHIAHLGVATRTFSFRLRGLPAPQDDVAVELTAPSGDVWRWGDPAAGQRVAGPALDFCLVVTQRRHLSDTALTVTGDVAARWMSLAQAFAGVPGPGRQPLTHTQEDTR